MKRRVWLFRICCICILSIVLSGCKLIEAPPNLSTADVLRGVKGAVVVPECKVAVANPPGRSALSKGSAMRAMP